MNTFLELKEARSTLPLENLQEILDAEGSAKSAAQTGMAQYLTPSWFVDQCNQVLTKHGLSLYPATALDPQIGEAALIKCGSLYNTSTLRFGVDIDNRLEGLGIRANLITANCMRVFEALDDMYPDTRFVCINANPPFGKRWKKPDGSTIDSTEATWDWVTRHGNYGFFIGNHETLRKSGIYKGSVIATPPGNSVDIFEYQTHDASTIWPGVDLTIGVAFWKRAGANQSYTDPNLMVLRWNKVKAAIDQERAIRPKWNIYLDHNGCLRTYLSIRSEVKLKLSRDEIHKLARINEAHPLAITVEKETRQILQHLVDCGYYTIEPAAHAAIQSALAEMQFLVKPSIDSMYLNCKVRISNPSANPSRNTASSSPAAEDTPSHPARRRKNLYDLLLINSSAAGGPAAVVNIDNNLDKLNHNMKLIYDKLCRQSGEYDGHKLK